MENLKTGHFPEKHMVAKVILGICGSSESSPQTHYRPMNLKLMVCDFHFGPEVGRGQEVGLLEGAQWRAGSESETGSAEPGREQRGAPSRELQQESTPSNSESSLAVSLHNLARKEGFTWNDLPTYYKSRDIQNRLKRLQKLTETQEL